MNVEFCASNQPAGCFMANLQLTHKGTICHVSMIFATVNFDFYVIADILPTGIICTSVKRLCKSFYRQNGLQNRFTENSESANYDNEKNIFSGITLKLSRRLERSGKRSAGAQC